LSDWVCYAIVYRKLDLLSIYFDNDISYNDDYSGHGDALDVVVSDAINGDL